jgi:hypothetical protein
LERIQRKENLNSTWTDNEKDLDNVTYSWMEKSTEVTGMNNRTVKFCILSMEKWSI